MSVGQNGGKDWPMAHGKTRYADDQTLAYIAKLEAERDAMNQVTMEWERLMMRLVGEDGLRSVEVAITDRLHLLEEARATVMRLTAERDKLKEQREYWMAETARLRDADRTLVFVCDKLTAQRDKLDYELTGVMHSVDKWFDEVPSHSPVARAAAARAIALTAIERESAERDKYRDALREIWHMPPDGTWSDQFHQTPSQWRAVVRRMYDAAESVLEMEE